MQVDKLETSESLRKEEEQATETQPIVYGKGCDPRQRGRLTHLLLVFLIQDFQLKFRLSPRKPGKTGGLRAEQSTSSPLCFCLEILRHKFRSAQTGIII